MEIEPGPDGTVGNGVSGIQIGENRETLPHIPIRGRHSTDTQVRTGDPLREQSPSEMVQSHGHEIKHAQAKRTRDGKIQEPPKGTHGRHTHTGHKSGPKKVNLNGSFA